MVFVNVKKEVLMKEWLLENMLALIGYLISGGLLTWIFTDKVKRRSERKKEESNALSGIQNVYDTFVEDMKEQYKAMSDKIKDLEEKVSSLQKDYSELQIKHQQLCQDYDVLLNKYNKLKNEVSVKKEKKSSK